MFPSTSARASHSSSVLSKVRTWNLHRIWPDELADLGRLAFLRPHPEPSVGAVLQWTGRERDRGEIRALPHGYERPFVSSRLALARRVVRRFAWAVRGAPRRVPRCPGPGRAQRRRRGDGGFRRGACGPSLLRRRAAGRMADRSDDGTTPLAATAHDAAELHVDCKRFPPLRPRILDQTATEPRIRYRATMVGADRRLYNGRGDQRRMRARSHRWSLV